MGALDGGVIVISSSKPYFCVVLSEITNRDRGMLVGNLAVSYFFSDEWWHFL
jgi:hypothetical protein